MAIPGGNSIFKKMARRILDPYAGKEILELRTKDNEEQKVREQVRATTVALNPVPATYEETSPLDDLIEGFHQDLHIQDPVEIIRLQVVPETEVKPAVRKPRAAPKAKGRIRAVDPQQDNDQAQNETEKPTPEPVVVAWTDTRFWDWIAGLGWGDRSDRPNLRRAEDLVRRLNPATRDGMLGIYNRLYATLSENMQNFMKQYDMGEENRRALLSHIIARGEQFYMAICADPDFASYLITDASRPAEHNEFIDFSRLLN